MSDIVSLLEKGVSVGELASLLNTDSKGVVAIAKKNNLSGSLRYV